MPDEIKKLAIVGASVRAATFSALRAGYEVVAADLFADADLQRECSATAIRGYPEALADWLAGVECDAWLYTGALENHAELISRMAKLRPLLGNSSGALRAVRNPLVLQTVLQTEGVSFPETVDSSTRLPLDGSWLCKTYRGASGSGVWLLFGAEARDRAEKEKAFYQRFVSGISAAAVFVCSPAGSRVLGVTRQLVGDARASAKPWHYAGSIGPLPVSKEVQSQLAKLGELFSTRFQLRGLVGVDLVIADNRAWILEINPRYTSSAEIVERTCGESLIVTHVAACQGRSEAPSLSLPKPDGIVHGKIVVYAKRDVEVSDRFHTWAIDQSAVDAEQCLLADIPSAGQQISSGQPVLTVFGSGAASDIEAELGRRVFDVESKLYQQLG
jgi:predicted ATP-grasp superfamily ATP-dependent carboligase